MFLNPIPGAAFLLGAAASPTAQKVTHARFLVLIVGVMVVFLGALALLTVVRMLRRRAAARLDTGARASEGGVRVSAWHAAGQRAAPVPARSQSPREEDDEDDGEVDDGSGEFPPLGDDDSDDTDFGDDEDDDAGPRGRLG